MSNGAPPSIHEQADAVELAFVNHRGHVRNLAGLVDKGKQSGAEPAQARRTLPGLEAAVATLRFLELHAEAFKRFMAQRYGSTRPSTLLGERGEAVSAVGHIRKACGSHRI